MLSSIADFDKNYRVEKKIGSGGMGDVYLATDKRLDRSVAVKVLKIEEILNRIDFIERFRNEAKSIAKLSHPNIVSIYDFGDQDNIYYMIMEYLEGSNLKDLIQKSKQRIPHTLIVNIAIQMCNALQYAHDNNVIHRDVKPDNIILTNKGIVKLTDFGIVLLDKERGVKNNEIVGSILYSSPEQLTDASSVNEKSDLYSLGLTLYEMLVGKNPFYKNEIAESIKSIMLEVPDSPHSIYSDIPKGLSDIIMKSIEKISHNRYLNIRELKKELSAYADQETILENNFIEINNNLSNTSSTNTIKINNTLVSTLDYKSTINKKNDTNFDTVITKNINIKNYSWINNIIQIDKGKSINNGITRQSLNKIIDNNNKFTGFILIDNNFFLFFHKGFVIGALDINKNDIGNIIYKSIPEKFNSLSYKESDDNEFLPLIINNLISNGIELYKDLDNKNTNLRDFLKLFLNNTDRFDGFIEIYQQVTPKKKILYVEDDKIAQLLLTKYFKENDLPYEITISETISESIKKIKENEYDLVILDYFLGDGTAKDFITKKISNTPIILTTSSNNSDILIDMLKEGVRDYIIKKNNNDYYYEISKIIKNIIGGDKSSLQPSRSYISYNKSNPILSLSVDNSGVIENTKDNILSDFDLENCSISIYEYNINILSASIPLIMKNTTININKKDKKVADYNFFIETNENLSIDIENKIKSNLDLTLHINNNQANIEQVIHESLYFKFSNWIIKEYFPLINHSDKIQDMFIIYGNIPKINKISFFVNFFDKEIPIVFYNSSNLPCMFAIFGNGDFNSINSFVENSINIKNNLESLESIIYISTGGYEQQSIDLYTKYTKQSGFSLFTKKSKHKGIIKIDDKKNLQFNILNYNIKTNNFDSVLPSLF